MKKRSLSIISLLLLLCITLGSFVSCGDKGGDANPPEPQHEHVDYVSATKLDMNSTRLRQEVTVKFYIDGDTTHFHVPTTLSVDGVFKARYLGVDTPESTGVIEEWGKAASNFTKEKLSNAVSIIIESDDDQWNYDGNGRALLWIWYKPSTDADYRNLNIELVQEGLGLASSDFEAAYYTPLWAAYEQAMVEDLYMHSDNIDPDYPYDKAVNLTIKELRTNIENYLGKNIAIEGVVTFNADNTAFVEQYDAETERYYAIQVFYGYSSTLVNLFKAGNLLRVVGTVTVFNGTYQINNVQYNLMKPNDPANSSLLSKDNAIAYPECSMAEWFGNVTVDGKTYTFQEIATSASISMTGLKVVDIYTTKNPTSDDYGAMTLTCEKDGKRIDIRTGVLKDTTGTISDDYKDSEGRITAAYFYDNNIIDVKGIIDYFDLEGTGNGTYQIKVLTLAGFTIH